MLGLTYGIKTPDVTNKVMEDEVAKTTNNSTNFQ